MRGCDADHTARAVSRIARARGALHASLGTSGRGRLRAARAFVASLQSCGSIHLGNDIRRLDREGENKRGYSDAPGIEQASTHVPPGCVECLPWNAGAAWTNHPRDQALSSSGEEVIKLTVRTT
jgi:hypothetical protein